jgi:hypothetical protein
MALSIEEISRRIGLKETAGSFDQGKEDNKQERFLEDNRQFTAGNPLAAPDITRVNQLSDTLYKDEALPDDNENREQMTAYFEKKTNTYNIGPGLNLDSPLVQKALSKQEIDPETLRGAYNFKNKESIDSTLVPVMRQVFNDVISGARDDVKSLVGGRKNWNSLKSHEQDALVQMSYNLGKPKLGGFKNMLGAVQLLINERQGKKGFADEAAILTVIADEMEDSSWYNQVGARAGRIRTQFTNGGDEASLRWLEGIHGNTIT